MFRNILAGILLLYLSIPPGDGLKCYHCYERFNRTLLLGSFDSQSYGSQVIPCDKDKSKWNIWNCPAEYSVCVLASGSILNETEIMRTCEHKGICANLPLPGPGVKVNYCIECSTNLCNDYRKLSDRDINIKGNDEEGSPAVPPN